MVGWTDSITIRAGATPLSFDGGGIFRFNGKGTRVTGLSLSHSLSTYTTDEGYALAVKLSDNIGLPSKNPVFFMGMVADAGPTTNKSAQVIPQDYIPLDYAIEPSSTMQIDITTIAGAVQTGTHDLRITIHYDAGDTPQDILDMAAAFSGMVPVKHGSYGTLAALATTQETPLVGNGTTLNIPGEMREIVAIVALQVLDTAITAAEEKGGHTRLEFSGVVDANKQEYPLTGGIPGLGTEVEGGIPSIVRRLPMYLITPGSEIQVSAFINALSAITGGADYAVNILSR